MAQGAAAWSHTLLVHGLPVGTSRSGVEAMFEDEGMQARADIPLGGVAGALPVTVALRHEAYADAAVRRLNGAQYNGCRIRVTRQGTECARCWQWLQRACARALGRGCGGVTAGP